MGHYAPPAQVLRGGGNDGCAQMGQGMRSVFFPQLVNGPFGDPTLYVRIAHRGEALLFDCGELQPLTQRELLKLRAVFLSHHHIDHVAGFATLLRSFLYSERPLLVFGPPGTTQRIGHHLAAITWNLTAGYPFVLDVREWGETVGRRVRFLADRGFVAENPETYSCPGGVLHTTPAWRVRAVPLAHGDISSLAFLLEEPLHVAIHGDALAREGLNPGPWLAQLKDLMRKGNAEKECMQVPQAAGGSREWTVGALARRIAHTEPGMKLAYVTDVSPNDDNARRIVGLARDAHLLAIEATFAEADHQLAVERHHLTARLAGELGRRAGVGRLTVFHHSPRYQREPERLRREAEAAFAGGNFRDNAADGVGKGGE
jgi:ribonuclease Z